MAKLSQLKVDSRAIAEGAWIKPGEEFDDLEIHTRGLTDTYFDAQAARQRKAAIPFGGNTDKIPLAIRQKINVELLKKFVLLDPPVRNLQGPDGKEITAEQFFDLLSDPDYSPLVNACYLAAAQVGRQMSSDIEDASGN